MSGQKHYPVIQRAHALAKKHGLVGLSASQVLELFEQRQSGQRIIVFTEKYGERCFDASTPDAVFSACFTILNDRYGEQGCWLSARKFADELRAKGPVSPGYTEQDVAGFPAPLQEDAMTKLKAYQKAAAQHNANIAEWVEIADALDNQDTVAAYRICFGRGLHEYESVKFVYLEAPKVPKSKKGARK